MGCSKNEIYQGEDKSLSLKVTVVPSCASFDLSALVPLTPNDDLIIKFNKEEGGCVEKKLSIAGEVEIVDASTGLVKVNLLAADTALLETGDKKTFEAEYWFGGKMKVIRFKNQLNVLAREC